MVPLVLHLACFQSTALWKSFCRRIVGDDSSVWKVALNSETDWICHKFWVRIATKNADLQDQLELFGPEAAVWKVSIEVDVHPEFGIYSLTRTSFQTNVQARHANRVDCRRSDVPSNSENVHLKLKSTKRHN